MWRGRRPKSLDKIIGRRLAGRYEVKQQIGHGGMGNVYLALQTDVGRDVAVKVMHPVYARDKETVGRFLREMHAMSRLRHPNTACVFDCGQTDQGLLFMVMELLRGRDLADVLDKERRVPLERAVHIVVQICDSLTEAHDQGIVHRDLKPENVHLETFGGLEDFVKVIDFGVAKVFGLKDHLTIPGKTTGTPVYMSPEQARGERVDVRSDIYALGVMLYEILAGEPPFAAPNPMEILQKHVNEAAPPLPLDVAAVVPAPVQELIERMLAKDRERRPPDCRSVAHQLTDASTPTEPRLRAAKATLKGIGIAGKKGP